MLETYIRPAFQMCLVDPIAKRILFRYSPLQITFAAAITGILIAPALLFGFPLLACLLLLLSGYFDALDGTVARMSNTSSPLGSLVDIVSDRMVELAVIVGLYAVDPLHRGAWLLLILGSCYVHNALMLMTNVLKPGGQSTQEFFYHSKGLFERTEAFICFFLMIAFPHYFTALAMLFMVLVLVTSYWQIKQFNKQ